MNKTLLLLFLFILQSNVFAQTEENDINEPTTTIPIEEYMELLISKIDLPDKIHKKADYKNILATVFFSIYKDGSVAYIRVQNDSLGLRPYIKTALLDLPKWNPKTENGKPVVSHKLFQIEIYRPKTNPLVYKHFYYNFKLPEKIQKRLGYKEFIVEFFIEPNGRLTEIEVVKSTHPEYNSLIKRTIKAMPRMKERPSIRSKHYYRFSNHRFR